jgi:zinc finger protein
MQPNSFLGLAEGAVYTARILTRQDLDRQIVKSETCSVIIPNFELTIPPSRGQLTTVEGLLRDVVTDLSADQPLRRIENEAAYTKIQSIIDSMKEILADEDEDEDESTVGQLKVQSAANKDAPMKPFVITLDDPAGNSFLEFVGNMADPKWNMRTYRRTHQHNIALGLINPDVEEAPEIVEEPGEDQIGGGLEGQNEEIYIFHGTCSSCGHKSDTLVKKVNIPYFKVSNLNTLNPICCAHSLSSWPGHTHHVCKLRFMWFPRQRGQVWFRYFWERQAYYAEGWGSRGSKPRYSQSKFVFFLGFFIIWNISQSESCGLSIPEIDLVLQEGTLGGRFTTLEGILDQIYEELTEKVFNDASNDNGVFENFLRQLKAVKNAERPFTLILDDPLANSYLQNLYAPDPDPNMTTEEYERTWQQNEDLGLNDMKVEGYENDLNTDIIEEEKIGTPWMFA